MTRATAPQLVVATLAAMLALATALARAAEPLASWNEGPAKRAVVEFVAQVNKESASTYVAPAERIAVFDNDGTLWAEQPAYFQALFVADRIKALSPKYPEWKTQEPFASLLRGDLKGVIAGGEKGLLQLVMTTHAGMTTDEFRRIVDDWIATARHPVTGRLYTEMVYQPMLQWTTAGEGARFALIVRHTDAAREWAYDRNSAVGHLDQGLDEAKSRGWTIVSMKDDWKVVFPGELK